MDIISPAAFADPVAKWLAICAGTFVLEDAATVEAALLAAAGHVGRFSALSALYVGVVIGDVGLYGLGALAARFAWARRWMPDTRRARLHQRAGARVVPIVIASRFVPGARLPTYVMCGYLRLGVVRFALASAMATSVWTTGLFSASIALGPAVARYLGPWQWLAPVGLVCAVVLVARFVRRA